jgi:hypothetical protein
MFRVIALLMLLVQMLLKFCENVVVKLLCQSAAELLKVCPDVAKIFV